MRMFQDQLAQTVKMAAMLQAQRIMTGGAGPTMNASIPTINLPQEVDEPPSKEEIVEYARWAGGQYTDLDLSSQMVQCCIMSVASPLSLFFPTQSPRTSGISGSTPRLTPTSSASPSGR